MKVMFALARLVCAGMLVWALARHPYGYFQLLRIVVIGVCAFGIYCAVEWKKTGWAWVFGVLAILFNPLVPIALGRQIWKWVDVVVAIFLVATIFLMREGHRESTES